MNDRPKLPRSVIILNIIMIILILVICGLVFSLAYSQVQQEAQTTTPYYVEEETIETVDAEATEEAVTQTTTTLNTAPTNMTKRPASWDETEEVTTTGDGPALDTLPSDTTSEPQTTEDSEIDEPSAPTYSMAYDKSFFKDDLFIGDSIGTGLYLYNKLEMENVAASVGCTPYKAYNDPIDLSDGTSRTAVEYAKERQPKRIFIMLGSNGLVSAGAMEDSYRTLIDKLQAACPKAEIYCISVTAVTSDSSAAAKSGITNDMVREFNGIVKSICDEYDLLYLDVYTLLLDENGYFSHDFAEADGLHFKGDTYNVMLSYIQSTLEAQ